MATTYSTFIKNCLVLFVLWFFWHAWDFDCHIKMRNMSKIEKKIHWFQFSWSILSPASNGTVYDLENKSQTIFFYRNLLRRLTCKIDSIDNIHDITYSLMMGNAIKIKYRPFFPLQTIKRNNAFCACHGDFLRLESRSHEAVSLVFLRFAKEKGAQSFLLYLIIDDSQPP